jgi:hypothetical protein
MRLRKMMDRKLLAEGRAEAVEYRVQLRLAMARASYMDEVAGSHLEFARVSRHGGDLVGTRRHVALAKEFHRERRTAMRQAYMIRAQMAKLPRSTSTYRLGALTFAVDLEK